MATRRSSKGERGLTASGLSSASTLEKINIEDGMDRKEDKPTADTDKVKHKKKNSFIVLILGALLLSFNVAAVMMMSYTKGKDGKYPFNTASTVVCAEFSKFIIASIGVFIATRK